MNKNLKNWIEIEGKTIEDAINEAVTRLCVPKEALFIKIICEEKKGLFDMGGEKPAKIKVTLKNI